MGTYVVTGGASGIGAQVVRDLTGRGDRVLIWDIQSPGFDTPASHERVDLSAPGSVARAAAQMAEPVQGFVHCAGIAGATSVGHANLAEQMRVAYEVHVVAFVSAVQSLLPRLIAGGGAVVAIASAAMDVIYPGTLAYGASKAALRRVIEQLAVEIGARGIRVNGVAPGAVHTPMSASAWADEAYANERKRYIPLGRQSEPSAISGAVLYLLSEKAEYVTGEVLWVDGGVRHGCSTGRWNTSRARRADRSIEEHCSEQATTRTTILRSVSKRGS